MWFIIPYNHYRLNHFIYTIYQTSYIINYRVLFSVLSCYVVSCQNILSYHFVLYHLALYMVNYTWWKKSHLICFDFILKFKLYNIPYKFDILWNFTSYKKFYWITFETMFYIKLHFISFWKLNFLIFYFIILYIEWN